ncbi:unnamed protein product [Cunninghamella blakesleeana]
MTITEINSEQVKEILQWVDKLPKKKKAIFQRLKEYQKIIEARQKRTQKYEWTVLSLERQYQRKLCEDRLLVSHQQQKNHIELLEKKISHCEEELQYLKSTLHDQQTQLQAARVYAKQRNEKYKKRQKQFHDYHKLPIMKTVYKKKYLRAQSKNQQAESQVSEILHEMDTVKIKQVQLSQSIREYQRQINNYQQEIHLIQERIQKNDQLLSHWLNGNMYWHETMANTCLMLEQRIVAVQHLIQQIDNNNNNNQNDQSFNKQKQQLNTILKAFEMICKEYEDKESYGQQEYSLDNIDFDCSKCMQSIHHGKPLPDKVNTSDILCEHCYQQTRTTMIIKKKLGFLQPNSKSHSSNSTLSFSSSSTNLSTPPDSRQSSFVIDQPPSVPPKDNIYQQHQLLPPKLEFTDRRVTA